MKIKNYKNIKSKILHHIWNEWIWKDPRTFIGDRKKTTKMESWTRSQQQRNTSGITKSDFLSKDF
jgi:hypothetical protein